MKKLEEKVKRILGDTPQLKILLAFYKEPASFTGMEGLMGMLQKDKETVRKIVDDLCDAGILIEVFTLNRDHPYTKAVFKLFKEIESEGEEKRKDDIL